MKTMPLCLLSMIMLLSSCGDDGGTIAAQVTTTEPVETVTLHHPSGRVQASGAVIVGTDRRTGVWTTYFDDESGQRQWEGTYRDGVVDRSQPWQEWNRDGSVRFTSDDE